MKWLLRNSFESNKFWSTSLKLRILPQKCLLQSTTRLWNEMSKEGSKWLQIQKKLQRKMKSHSHFIKGTLKSIKCDYRQKHLWMKSYLNQDSKQRSLHPVWLLKCSSRWWLLIRWSEKSALEEMLSWATKKQSCLQEWKCMRRFKSKRVSLNLKPPKWILIQLL